MNKRATAKIAKRVIVRLYVKVVHQTALDVLSAGIPRTGQAKLIRPFRQQLFAAAERARASALEPPLLFFPLFRIRHDLKPPFLEVPIVTNCARPSARTKCAEFINSDYLYGASKIENGQIHGRKRG
jgi:hypothetical protein